MQEGTQAPLATAVLHQVNNYEPISSLSSGFSRTTNSNLREIALPDRARREEAVQEHLLIADAIRAKDVEKLREALTVHVEKAKYACFKGIHNLQEHYKLESGHHYLTRTDQ
ncbi:hypothetical protein SDC9_168679 [bioreactor metagenome]|uniref:GntR C-terminal domain-containing protein n=1 Tax=bioreactor metagenome TaxID=1076179 RepID=A0A645G5U0_9ZZZZ